MRKYVNIRNKYMSDVDRERRKKLYEKLIL